MEKLSSNKLFSLFIFVIVVLQSGHAFQTIYSAWGYVVFLPAAIGVLYILSNKNCFNLRRWQNAMLWMLVFMILATAFVDMGSGISFYIQQMAIIFAAYFVVSIYSFDVVVKCYLKLMTVVAVIALIGYFLVNNTNVLDFLPIMKNVNGVEYRIGIIFNYIVEVPDRNCGMFWEPGLFATHLAIATILELITKEKANPWRLILFIACFITANSAAGFVLCFLGIALLLVRKRSEKYEVFKTIFSIFILVSVVVVVLNFDTILSQTQLGQNEYLQKLSSDNISGSSRSEAILHNLDMFSRDPVFGAGYTTVMQNMAHVADTSTSTFLMSIFGVLGVSYTLFIVYGVMKIKSAKLFSKIIIMVMLLIVVNKEPHHMILFTWILMFYFVKGFEMNNSLDTERKEIVTGEKI